MTNHAAIAIMGANAAFLAAAEACTRPSWRRPAVFACLAFAALLILAAIPCAPIVSEAEDHQAPPPTATQTVAVVDPVENLLLANYRNIRQQRTNNARPE